MASYVCETCSAAFKRRGNKPYRYCSRGCFQAARPRFDVAAWYAANREEQNAKRRAWAKANPEKRRAIRSKWQANNRAKLTADARVRRAAQKVGASVIEMEAIIAAAEGLCTYCGQPADRLEFDHLTAITRGGTNAVDNLLPCCRSCNASKSNSEADGWLYAKHGIEGLARAIFMLENRRVEPALYPGTTITEVR